MCISNTGIRRPYPVSVIQEFNRKNHQQVQQLLLLPTKAQQQQQQPQAQALGDASTSSSSSSSSSSNTRHKQAQHHHITVVHNYHDHANDYESKVVEDHPVRGGVTTPFPLMLHAMLLAVETEGMDDIISWQPHGRCFLVHKPKEFAALLPRFFKLSKLASFQRQLNLYGFQRLTHGNDRGGYYHELFLRHRVFLAHNIQRIKVKGTGVRGRSNPDQEPDFWQNLPWVVVTNVAVLRQEQPELSQSCNTMILNSLSLNTNQEQDLLDAFEKPFHYLDPFQPTAGNWTVNGVDALLEIEAESFFDDFEFDQAAVDKADIEDDSVFGDLLEQMIA